MKKFLKILVVMVAVVAGLVLVSTLVLHAVLPPEKAKALVLKQLSSRLQREIDIGSAELGLFAGLKLSDLKISEAPDFSKGTFLTSEEFSVKLALIPLLFRRVVVRQIILRQPEVTVVRQADGKTFNFSDLTTPTVSTVTTPASGAAPAKAEPPPFTLLVTRAEVQKGVVHFIDRSPAGQSIEIDGLQFRVKNVNLTSPFGLQASLRARARQQAITAKLAGETDWSLSTFKIRQFHVEGKGLDIVLNGRAMGLRSAQPSVDLGLDIKEASLATLTAFGFLPPQVPAAGKVKGRFRVKGDEQRMDLDGSGSLDALKLKLHGYAQGIRSPQPTLNLHAETESFPIEELLRLQPALAPRGVTLKGPLTAAVDVSGTLLSSQVNGKVDGKDLQLAYGQQFTKAAGVPFKLSWVGELLRPAEAPMTFAFKTLDLHLASIQLTGNGVVRTSKNTTDLQMQFKSNRFALADLTKLSPLAAPYRLAGNASIDGKIGGTSAQPSLSGTTTLHEASAHFQNSDLTRLQGTVTFDKDDVSIPKLTGQLNGSDLTLKLVGRKMSGAPELTVDATVGVLDLDKLLPPVTIPPAARSWIPLAYAAAPVATAFPTKVTAHLVAGRVKHELYQAQNLDFKCNLTELTPELSRVNGSAVLRQGEGRLQKVEKLMAASKSARMVLLPIHILQRAQQKGHLQNVKLPSLENIPFNSLKGDYAFRQGTADIQPFELVGTDLSLVSRGTVGLAGLQPVNLKVQMKLAAGSVRGTLGQIFSDETGRPTVDLTIGGTVSEPETKLELEDVGRKALKQAGDELRKIFGR